MAPRIATAAAGLPLLTLAVWIGSPWFSVLLAAVAAIGAMELCEMASRTGRRPVAAGSAVWAVGLVAGGHLGASGISTRVTLPAVVVAGAVASLGWAIWRSRPALGPVDWAVTAGAALYTGGLLAYGPLLRELDQGREWVFYLLAVNFSVDTAAFLVGKAVGARAMAPTVSPGKTWEGAAGGLLGAVAASAATTAAFGLAMSVAASIALGGLMAVVGQLGDLAESKLKRAAGVKDSGRLFPGHGGMLDRLDSIVFNLALVYHFVIWVAK